QFEIPIATVVHTARFARTRAIRCIVNAAPAVPVDLGALGPVDYLIPNETEAEALTGLPVDTDLRLEACARRLLESGVRRVIITLGHRGALLAADDAMQLVPSFAVETRDTTGAGDAFIGSFAVFLMEGASEVEAIRRANLYAAMSTTCVGTQRSFRTREEFDGEWASGAARVRPT